MKPTPEQIAGDRYYFETCTTKKTAPVGARFRMMCKPYDQRPHWFRVWEKTEKGWKFVGMQCGREPIVRGEDV